jgi:uncharacterized paraquat-inducible protein A
MIKFKCPHCDRDVSVADEHAGKKARCPACREIFQIPQARAAVEEIPEARPRPKAAPPERPRRPAPVEEEEDLPEAEAADDEPEEEAEEERPRRKKKKIRARGQWADCPNCDAPGDATRIWYTWWGAWLGPLLICHVRCNRCGTAYNGNSGQYNTAAIAIYVVVTTIIALAIVILAAMAEG